MASHFIKALGVPLLHTSKAQIHCNPNDKNSENKELDENFDVNTCMEAELSVNNIDSIEALMMTDFNAGDVVGKLMAFLSQLWACGEDVCDFLKCISVSMSCPSWDIKLWICTCWGSLSDCFHVVLIQQKVCALPLVSLLVIILILLNSLSTAFAELQMVNLTFHHF